jgi:hypothetical protein
MYRYEIEGKDMVKGKAIRLGRTTAVIVDREFEGEECMVVIGGTVKRLEERNDD